MIERFPLSPVLDKPVLTLPGRGEINARRSGRTKIHCHHIAAFTGTVPRGTAAKVVARLRHHDWNRNQELRTLRQRGYVPYRCRQDPAYSPRPLRLSVREESRRALTALSLALAANCDYNPDAEYPFEIVVSFEEVAKAMGVLHIYENGRKAFDVATHAREVMEQLGYIIVHRAWDKEAGQYKPLRLFLTPSFFTSRGITVEEIRQWLHAYRQWAAVNGLCESLRKRHERHQLRMARLGIGLEKQYALRKRLQHIKRYVTSPDLCQEKQTTLNALEQELALRLFSPPQKIPPYQQAWRKWAASALAHPLRVIQWKQALSREHPYLEQDDPEHYYRLLLERAGAL